MKKILNSVGNGILMVIGVSFFFLLHAVGWAIFIYVVLIMFRFLFM